MESAVFSVILQDFYSTIRKCSWLVFVLTSGYLALTEGAFLFSLASESSLASKGEIAHRVGAPQGFWCGKVSMRDRAALCRMHIKTPSTVGFKERGRKMREGSALKYSWEAFRILYSHE